MSYRVFITERADDDLQQACTWWAKNRSIEQAEKWYDGFSKAIRSLADNPERRPLAKESEIFSCELRQLNYGLGRQLTHRALFTIRLGTVLILRVRHLAQKSISHKDL